jgi:DNA-binding response OmpR family regulator
MSWEPTVLIVEDERDLADAFAAALEVEYDVRTAYDGEDALDQIDDEVGVVLLDRKMPGLSGQDVLEEIRASGFECRVAMVTAVQPDVDIIDMGFDDYVVKPVSHDQLRTTVERLLLLAEHGEPLQEFISKSVKQVTLERIERDGSVERTDAYESLKEEVSAMSAELGDISAQLSEEEFDMIVDVIAERMGGTTSEPQEFGSSL